MGKFKEGEDPQETSHYEVLNYVVSLHYALLLFYKSLGCE